ncbi:hypothetical protein VE02_05098 [Pseudogymnoascus sp. 03VT05]|nr:hypothetical protein VE02_05098 [Pseudogymnoascus sp. 03VT05]
MGVTTRKSRFDSRSTSSEYYDDDTGTSTIELFTASKDTYRVAPFGKIPLPWPYSHGMASEKAAEMREIFEIVVQEILQKYHVTSSTTRVMRMWRRGLHSTAKDTLIISTDDTDTTMWSFAVDDIYDTVSPWATEVGLPFRVEIRNQILMYTDISTAPLYEEGVEDVMSQIEPVILAKVKSLISDSWKSVTVHGRQPLTAPRGDRDSNTTTVVILVQKGAVSLWDYVEEQLCQIVDGIAPPGMRIALEILPANFVPSVVVDMEPGPPKTLIDVPSAPTNGSSIAPQSIRTEARSMGPVVMFKPAGSSRQYKAFLTCYHVVAPGDERNSDWNDNHGIGFNDLPRPPIRMSWPARYDVECTMTDYARKIADGTNTQEFCARKMLERATFAGRFPPSATIGEVLYASGKTHNAQGNKMDWALIVFNPAGPGDGAKNELPLPVVIPEPFNTRNDKFEYEARPGDVVSGIGKPDPKYPVRSTWVGYVGRSSGAVGGQVVKLSNPVRWADGTTTPEIEVASLASGINFTTGGDSGSLVFDFHHRWVGMVITAETFQGLGYITAADAIIEDIERRTGGKLTLL